MTPTPQQTDFISAVGTTADNIVLKAVAGAGKTTTLVDASKEGPQDSALAVAFNKKTADELVRRFPSTYTVKTMNALGHAAWGRQLGRRLELNTEKISALAETVSGGRKQMWQTPGLKRLIDIARLHEFTPNTPDADWYDLGDKYDVIDPDCEYEALYPERCRKILDASIRHAWQGQIDFCDQLYMPVAFKSPFTRYNFVMVDEAQDLSPIQQKMIRRSTASRLVIVGDPAQSIYGFAGATTDGMEIFAKDFSMREMPLTFSFRCPKSVVAMAQRYNSAIQAHPNAPEGEARVSDTLTLVQRGDTIVSYRNADLLSCVFFCLSQGIGAKIIGSGDLAKILKDQGKKFGFSSRTRFIDEVTQHYEEKAGELLAAGKESKANRVREQGQCLKIIVLSSPDVTSTATLLDRIDQIFSLDGGAAQVTCTTIHKAKGLEWERVHFYNPGTLFKGFDKRSEEDKQQRRNMAYVALTRSKSFLNVIKPKKEEEGE